MKQLSWTAIFLAGVITLSDTSANTVFDEDRGWVIHRLEQSGIAFGCVAEKQIQTVQVAITPLMFKENSFALLSLSLRQGQTLKKNELKAIFDEHQVAIPRSHLEMNSTKINLLIDSADIDLQQLGNTQSLQINLSPHTRVELGSPKYATYLLKECIRTVDSEVHQSEMMKIAQKRFPNLNRFASVSPEPAKKQQPDQNENTPKPESPKNEGGFPAHFKEFVRAFTMNSPDKIEFLPIDDARTKYNRDWIDSGWTGESKLVFGVGYLTDLEAKDVIGYWEKDRRTNCKSLSGKFQQKDLGIRRDDKFLAHVGFTLCEIGNEGLALSKTAFDVKSKAFGITEVVAYGPKHLKSLNKWFDELD
jgi:hypothetical protein